jgi:hypothetical protein
VRRVAEGEEPVAVVDRGRDVGLLAADRGRHDAELARQDLQVVQRGEHHRLGLGAGRRHLRAGRHGQRVLLGRGQPEGDRGPGRGGRPQADAEQVEELHVGALGHPVEPPQDLVGHVREGLDQRHPGVVDVVVGPLGAALLDQPLGVVDQRLERAIVEVGGGQRHDYSSAGSV